MPKTLVRLVVNGLPRDVAVEPQTTLALALRDGCGLTGTKIGCDLGTCGCCTVLLDGRPALACLTLALDAEGRAVTTIEGISARDASGSATLHPLQEEFARCGGSQCGYCTPGFVMTAVALLRDRPSPTDGEIRDAISGNLCRCTGYVKIVEAIGRAADRMRGNAASADRPAESSPLQTV